MLETQQRVTIRVQKQSAVKPRRADIEDEVLRQATNRSLSCMGRVSTYFVQASPTDWMRYPH